MRLRGEAGVLRNELQEARRRAVTAAPRAALLETNAPPAPAVVAYTGSVSASIANGQTLVMGGWAVSPGRRILLFVTPQIEPSPQGPGQVTYRTKLVEVPETVMSTLGLDGLKTQDNTSSPARVSSRLARRTSPSAPSRRPTAPKHSPRRQ